jgi:hypothetical protein
MKTLRRLIMVVLAIAFIGGMSAVVWSGTPKYQKKKDFEPQVKVVCPIGWHKITAPGELIKCVPDKPKPIKCPEGTIYYETECAVGCKAEIK